MKEYAGFLVSLVTVSRVKRYLELGISDGQTFDAVSKAVSVAYGVDIKDRRITTPRDNQKFFKQSTDDFFKSYSEKNLFDFIFIDAYHKYEQVIKDFENALKLLDKYGTIALHDTDPASASLLAADRCDDSYKMIEYIRDHYSDLESITLPITKEGMTFIKRKNGRRVLSFL